MSFYEIKETIKTWKDEWKVSSIVFSQRMNQCKGCDNYITSPIERCHACGCVLLIKANYTKSKCPINKW